MPKFNCTVKNIKFTYSVAGIVATEFLRFVLEVAGASGAVWGSSEVMKHRHEVDNVYWRKAAYIVAGFALSMYLMEHVAKRLISTEEVVHLVPVESDQENQLSALAVSLSGSKKAGIIVGGVLGTVLRLILEVGGATGAVWGSSEVFGLRDESNSETWRKVASGARYFAFAMLLIEYAVGRPVIIPEQEKTLFSGFLLGKKNPSGAIKALCQNASAESVADTSLPYVSAVVASGVAVGFLLRFVLEVMGASGAIWGNSEIFDIRHDSHNKSASRMTAMVVGAFSFLKFSIEIWQMKALSKNYATYSDAFLNGKNNAIAVTKGVVKEMLESESMKNLRQSLMGRPSSMRGSDAY